MQVLQSVARSRDHVKKEELVKRGSKNMDVAAVNKEALSKNCQLVPGRSESLTI